MRYRKIYKICKRRKRIFFIFYNISPPKFGSFTNFNVLFLALDLLFFAKMKIQCRRGMVHYLISYCFELVSEL